jgi:hypothetical protein
LAAIQAVTPSLGVELTPVDVRNASGIEHSIAGLNVWIELRTDRHDQPVGVPSSRVDRASQSDLARLRPERFAVLGAIAVEPATAEWFFTPERARRCCRNEVQAAQRS